MHPKVEAVPEGQVLIEIVACVSVEISAGIHPGRHPHKSVLRAFAGQLEVLDTLEHAIANSVNEDSNIRFTDRLNVTAI